MLSPKTPEELAQAIEVLVASYLVEVRRVAQLALDEAFARAVSKPSVAKVRRPHGAHTRRGSEALAELADKLLTRVCGIQIRPHPRTIHLLIIAEEARQLLVRVVKAVRVPKLILGRVRRHPGALKNLRHLSAERP